MDSEFDRYETDDNVFSANQFPQIEPAMKYSVSNRTLNTPVDCDWFAISAPNTEIDKLNFALDSSSSSKVNMELYYVSSGTALSKVTAVSSTDSNTY